MELLRSPSITLVGPHRTCGLARLFGSLLFWVVLVNSKMSGAAFEVVVLPSDELNAFVANTFHDMTADGSTILGNHPYRGSFLWTHSGEETDLTNPFVGATGTWAITSDGSLTLRRGQRRDTGESGLHVWRQATNELITLGIPPGGDLDVDHADFSPDGRIVVGNSRHEDWDPELGDSFELKSWVWDFSTGFRILEDLPARPEHSHIAETYGSSAMAITNGGIVYGNSYLDGLEAEIYTDPAGYFQSGVRWDASGNPEVLNGSFSDGRQWAMTQLVDVSDDGTRQLGHARITRIVDGETIVLADRVMGVFGQESDPWILGEVNRLGTGGPIGLAISGDGSTVVGNLRDGPGRIPPIYVWTEDGTEGGHAVALDTMLQLAGIDLSAWNVHEVIEISRDGRRILVGAPGLNFVGTEQYWTQYFLVIVPEPAVSTLLLLGLGILGSSRRRTGASKKFDTGRDH